MEYVRESFRVRLREEFLSRNQKNPSYSLRAFANNLDVPVGSLSRILNGRVGVTPQRFRSICQRLGFSPAEMSIFIGDDESSNKESDILLLSEDQFKAMAHWIHFAILEVLTITGGPKTSAEIAKHFEINITQVKGALARLERLKLISCDDEGQYHSHHNSHSNVLDNNQMSSATNRLQEEILELSLRALKEVPLGYRDHSSLTFTMSQEDLEKGIAVIKRFRRSFEKKVKKNQGNLQVFQLSIGLFPISQVIQPNQQYQLKEENL